MGILKERAQAKGATFIFRWRHLKDGIAKHLDDYACLYRSKSAGEYVRVRSSKIEWAEGEALLTSLRCTRCDCDRFLREPPSSYPVVTASTQEHHAVLVVLAGFSEWRIDMLIRIDGTATDDAAESAARPYCPSSLRWDVSRQTVAIHAPCHSFQPTAITMYSVKMVSGETEAFAVPRIMIKCPTTGKPVPTGMDFDR